MDLKEAPVRGPYTRTPLELVPYEMVKVFSSPRRTVRVTHPNGDFLPLTDDPPFSPLENLPMGYCNCYNQLKSVPDDQ